MVDSEIMYLSSNKWSCF